MAAQKRRINGDVPLSPGYYLEGRTCPSWIAFARPVVIALWAEFTVTNGRCACLCERGEYSDKRENEMKSIFLRTIEV